MVNSGSVISSNYYLLTNTEFKFAATLIGFEFYANTAGSVLFAIWTFPVCGSTILCADYFKTSSSFTSRLVKYWIYSVTIGYNKILVTSPVKVPRGGMVYLDMVSYNGRIAFDNDAPSYYTDYYASSTTISRIDSNKNIRFHLNCLIEQPYFDYNFNSLFSFYQNGLQNLSIKFLNNITSSSSVTRQVLIFNSKHKRNICLFILLTSLI